MGSLSEELTTIAWEKYSSYFLNEDIQANIHKIKEEQFQEGFLRELFVKVLGYTINPSSNYNLTTELKNEVGSKKADGAILIGEKVIGVIELKDHKTPDLASIENQAFGYKSKHKDTKLVIISNFEKLRLYIDDAVEHREWDIFHMTYEDFRELYLCLAWTQVERGIALQMKQESVSSEDQITKALYKDYSQFKRTLFADIIEQNPAPDGKDEKEWQLLLFKKTQKLLDRLLFIFFAEDCGLLPPNMIKQIIDQYEKLKEMDEYRSFYNLLKKHFGYINTGHQDIFAYNGGLFKPDEVLDTIQINDELLVEHTKRLSTYDFESDVDVNILGHIFENSLSEIEEVTQQINSGEAPQTSKRKQDGVFYTPQYITKYIVENTVGRLCKEKKQKLGIVEDEYISEHRRQMQTKKRLVDQLEQYRKWLENITILDPACGSGAFLNAALRFLMDEHHYIDELMAKVTGSTLVIPDIENSILEKNLFGVDINEESVEIAQLALWLRTAKPHRKLNSLNENIKCGNSLISNPAIAGDKAFDWQKEFPLVFEKGGFDVVIGNPPYVQLQSMGAMSDAYAQCGYETYNKMADLYCLFYEQGCRLLKDNGVLGFIASNKWLKINYGEPLRRYLVSKMNPLLLVDFPGVPVFEDATVDPQILIVRKQQYAGKTQACAVKAKNLNIEEFVNSQSITTTFSSEPWTIRDAGIATILTKMDKCGMSLKELPLEIYRGILTGFNDAFYIDGKTKSLLIEKDSRSQEIISPLLRGRDITAWTTINQNLYIINTHNGLKEKGVLPVDINDYPVIKEHLDNYINQLTKRGDKGDTPYNLRNCAYLEEFAKPKIIYPNMTKFLPFCYDETKSLANQKCYILTTRDASISLKFLTAVFNSTLIKLWIRCICPELGEDRREIGKVYFEKLHVPIDSQQSLIVLADSMLSLNSQLQEKRSRFLGRLGEELEGVKINTALQTFDNLSFAEFKAELKKQKIHIPLKDQDEWAEFFNLRKTECQELTEKIAQTDKEIDLRVYRLYGLTYEEVLTVDPETTITNEEYEQ
jgi:type I restriction-modification system DNA methylase subunit